MLYRLFTGATRYVAVDGCYGAGRWIPVNYVPGYHVVIYLRCGDCCCYGCGYVGLPRVATFPIR